MLRGERGPRDDGRGPTPKRRIRWLDHMPYVVQFNKDPRCTGISNVTVSFQGSGFDNKDGT